MIGSGGLVLADGVTHDEVEVLISGAPELQAMPAIAQRALDLAERGDTSPSHLADLLSTDEALAASVLRAANSASAMPNHRIASLREALVRIGLSGLAGLLARAVASPMLDRGLPPYALSRRSAWRHALVASRAAACLAQRLAPTEVSREEAAVCGLLHDLGKTVLATRRPETIASVVAHARRDRLPVWQVERAELAFDHGVVGGALLRHWQLPPSIVAAVEHHHQPLDAGRYTLLASIVHLADALATLAGAYGGAGACPSATPDPEVLAMFGLVEEDLGDALEDLARAWPQDNTLA